MRQSQMFAIVRCTYRVALIERAMCMQWKKVDQLPLSFWGNGLNIDSQTEHKEAVKNDERISYGANWLRFRRCGKLQRATYFLRKQTITHGDVKSP